MPIDFLYGLSDVKSRVETEGESDDKPDCWEENACLKEWFWYN